MEHHWTLDEILGSACGGLNGHLKKPKRNKFGNIRTEIDGYTFDSKKESRRYVSLKMLQAHGLISDLQIHVEFKLSSAKYVCDFCYLDREGHLVVEDVKSPATRTAVYKLKRRMMQHELNIIIQEV